MVYVTDCLRKQMPRGHEEEELEMRRRRESPTLIFGLGQSHESRLPSFYFRRSTRISSI